MKEGIDKIYSYRQEFLVIGLTGRTGSGCTTAASILSTDSQEFTFPDADSFENLNENDKRKNKIIMNFVKKNRFPFYKIQVKDIITAFILENSFETLLEFLKEEHINLNGLPQLHELKNEYDNFHARRISIKEKETEENIEKKINEAFNFHFTELQLFSNKLKEVLNNNYYSIYQSIANNIRSTGVAIPSNKGFDISKTDTIVWKINKLIKLIRKKVELDNIKNNTNKKSFIVIDALRNPFEVHFLKERYSAFYLISINTSEEERKNRLTILGYDKNEIKQLDKQEYPDKLKGKDLYISQNLQNCMALLHSFCR